MTAEEEVFNAGLGRHIEALRKRAGLTQKQLAKDIGTRQQTLASIECGRIRCSLYMMAKIARRLDVPVASLVRFTRLCCFPAEGSCAPEKIV